MVLLEDNMHLIFHKHNSSSLARVPISRRCQKFLVADLWDSLVSHQQVMGHCLERRQQTSDLELASTALR